MDPELPIIFAFVLTLVFTGLAFAFIMHRRVTQHEERKLELEARIQEAKAAQRLDTRQSDNLLEDRVRVLERIVTDSKDDLAAQIEDLRREERAR